MLRAHEQAAGHIDPLEHALAFAGAVLDRDPFAKAKRVIEPSGANAVERLSGAPGIEGLAKASDEALKQFAAIHHLSPCPRQTRGCIPKALRRMCAIRADPDHAGGPPAPKTNAFDEDPGAFRASAHQIVRPFETDVCGAEIPRGARQRHAGDEAELRRHRRRTGIDHEGGGVKVALRRNPGSSASASSRGLFVGDDPQAAGVAGERAATRLLVSGVNRAQANDAPAPMRALKAGGGGQKSDCAAAIAASVSGEGANMNRMIMSAETARTMRATGAEPSKAVAGSSKYISLTILR
jgi:hypothetical protein